MMKPNHKKQILTLILLLSLVLPITIAFAWNVTGDVKYFYAYHWEEWGITGVNIRCKVDLDHSGDPPEYIKFRYGIRVLGDKESAGNEKLRSYYITEWQVLGWQGDGIYDNWWNWIPDNPEDAEWADLVIVDIYVDDDYEHNINGADFVCDDVTIIYDLPP